MTAGASPVAHHATQAIADQLRAADATRSTVRLVGAGTWPEGAANAAQHADATLSLAGDAGIVEYVPGDLTITVRAGTSLGAVAHATAAAGQWLTLDPRGDDDGTVGATVATASAGPLATAFGTPRDLVLGMEAVTGDGRIIRAGGRVVKNVAGFDLARLFTGAWGTLGAITELSFRLRARPEVERSLAIPLGEAIEDVTALRRTMRGWPFTPMAAELLDANAAAAIDLASRTTLIVRLGGNEDDVAAQATAAIALARGDVTPVPAEIWSRLRAIEPASCVVLRFVQAGSLLDEGWHAAGVASASYPGAFRVATPWRGEVRLFLPADAAATVASVHPGPGRMRIERVPATAPAHLAAYRMSPLEARVRQAFDPHHVLNPGLFIPADDRS